LTCSGIDALQSFPGASRVSSRFVLEGVFRDSGGVHSFKVVDPILFTFESHVLYSRNLEVFILYKEVKKCKDRQVNVITSTLQTAA